MEFIFKEEDHTLGNLLQQNLARRPEVKFAGYILPHPLEKKIKLKIESYNEDDSEKIILKNTIKDILSFLDLLEHEFVIKNEIQNDLDTKNKETIKKV